ncbi:helix-turn-helix domain-containing protein, partial [Azospirillum brasilense]|uniref:helix-turn-helix domain-containing protein n=1 Tax=Azospirillum brasilense TaxID=192 RepID=UPI000E0B28AE
ALPPRRAWDDDDAAEDVDWRPRVDEEPTPTPLSGGTPPLVAAVAAATAALVRLDERLARSPPALRAGWQARMVLEDAAAAVRLDHGPAVNPRVLRDHDLGIIVGPSNPDVARAALVLALLRHLLRRSPRHLFRPARLLAGAGHRRPTAATRAPGPGRLPAWTGLFVPDRAAIHDALVEALDPVWLEELEGQPPLLAAARFVGHWHRCGAAALLGGTPGRQLAAAWLVRAGLLEAQPPLMNVGWLGARAAYTLDDSVLWPCRFAEAAARAAERGLQLHRNLDSWRGRLQEAAGEGRRASVLPRAVEVLVARPGVSATALAAALGVTPRAAQTLLDGLRRRGLVADVTGRQAFRVWTAPERL